MPTESSSDGDVAEPVFRLIYRSHSLINAVSRSSELASIFTSARRNNRGHEITGALLVSNGVFVQALEGAEGGVRELFEVIRADRRHDQVKLVQQTVAPRTFGRWAMAEVSDDEGPDIRLVSNAKVGEIVAMGKDPSITPVQEQVLRFMRAAAASD
jgi:hypothetical protein